MRKFERHPCPEILNDVWKEYGERYSQNRDSNPGFQFQWPQINKRPLNQHLLPNLKAQTQNHCSYCDHFPPRAGDETIDHFKPKSIPEFYLDVCKWENLYFCCNACQTLRGSEYDGSLLRPDDPNFEFKKYFIYNYKEHKIEINSKADPVDKIRAEITIKIFHLNDAGNKAARRLFFNLKNKDEKIEIDDLPYRFMF